MQITMSKRASNIIGWIVLAFFAAGFAVGLAEPRDLLSAARDTPWLWIGAAGAFSLASVIAGFVWMKGVDELAQRAHYVAWYWGGSVALAVIVFLFLCAPALVRVVDFAGLLAHFEPVFGAGAGFFAGLLTSMVLLTAGYGLWWGVYWLRKR